MIKVMIERYIADGLADHYRQCARSTLQTAMGWHGFLSGETLQNKNDPNHQVLIACYRTLQDWQSWQQSSERQAMMDQLRPMMVDDEKVTIFEHS